MRSDTASIRRRRSFVGALLLAFASAGTAVRGALPPARDTTFQTLPMDGLANSTVLLPDGKMIIGGNFQTIGGVARPGIARLNADGSLDASFAPPIGGPGNFGKPVVNDLAVAPGGKIVAAGSPAFRTTGAVLRTNIIRFNPDGSVDPTFDARDAAHFKGLAVQADGKVVYSTFIIAGGTGLFGPKRLNADGSVDAGFAYTGGIINGLGCVQFSAQPDGKVLGLAGDNDPNRTGNGQVFRLTASGANDPTFRFTSPPNAVVDDSRLAVAGDGRVLLAVYDNFVPAVTRISADGDRDRAFTYNGQPNGQGLYPVPAAFLPDGGAVVVRQPTAGDRRISFFYLSASGQLIGSRDLPNSAFDNGVVGVGTLAARAFAMQPDGKLLFAAAFQDGFANTFGMFRLPPPPAAVAPVITVHPVSKTIGAGEALFLDVTATSESPLTYQWQHSSTNLPRATNQFLNLFQDSAERAGDFAVVVANPFGAVTSRVATVVVRPPAAMVMTQQPVGGTVKLSQQSSLSAQCSTEVATGHQWYKDGAALPTGAGSGFGFASLNLPAGDPARGGDYFVVITNAFGGSVTSKVAHVDILLPGPPQITAQPQDLALFPGQPVKFAVTAVADGFLTYQWQRAGTNLLRSATVPNVNAGTLFIQGTDPDRGGAYSLIATVSPGGSTTSRVAQVTLLPSGPPVLLTQPASVSADLGQSSEFSAAFNGEAPVTVSWRHAGTNVPFSFGQPGQVYPTVDGPLTNTYFAPVTPSYAGDYQFVASNRWGAVTSAVATLTVRPVPGAVLVKDLGDRKAGIGEFNTVGLRADKSGLVVTNCCSQPETTHILQLASTGGIAPYSGTGTWHLAIGAGGRYHVGAQHGVDTATGTWGPVPGAVDFLGLFLTNFPRAGIVTRFEALDDGIFGMKAVAGSASPGSESGTFRVLGLRRPATNFLSFEVVSSNAVDIAWFKDGQLLAVNPPGTGGHLSVLNESAGTPPAPGGVNLRVRLTLADVVPEDAGRYQAVVTNYVRNPDTRPGQDPRLFNGTTATRIATFEVRGHAAERAPQVVSVVETGAPSGLEDATALAVASDGKLLLASRTQTFGAGSSAQSKLEGLGTGDRPERSAVLTAETLNGGDIGIIKAVVSDGDGGAYVSGDGAAGTLERWFLRRVRPADIITATSTNHTFTNLWTVRTAGPFTNGFDNFAVQHAADVVAQVAVPDGVLVAGHFMGRTRFGATNMVTNSLVPFFTAQVGGITLTNAYDAAHGRYDGSADIYVAKYDPVGRLAWVRQFGGTNNEVLTSFTADAAGNLYLGGSFKGRAAFGASTLESGKVVQNSGFTVVATDGFVAKLGPDGETRWAKGFGGTNGLSVADTRVGSVAVGPDGVYFAATRNAGTAFLLPGLAATPAYFARLNAGGELLWTQEIPVSDPLVVVDAAGDAVVTGSVPPSAKTAPLTFGAGTLTAPAFSGTALAKFDAAGSLLWTRVLDEKLPFADDARAATVQKLAFDAAGGLVAVGKLPGGTPGSAGRTSGQRFDIIELPSTNTMTADPSDLFIARLAPKFVAAPPRLVVAPVAQSGLLQDRLVLEGAASGSPAPAYQWLRDGVPVPGATNRLLVFSDLQRTNRGNYSLVVSNAFGSVASEPVAVTPKLRPEMTGWTLVTSATNYLGKPVRVAADDAGNSYLLHDETSRGGSVWLEKFGPDGRLGWRFPDSLLSPHAPVVAPGGEVFIAGRLVSQPSVFNRAENNFIARLRPEDGSVLWSKTLGNVVAGQSDIAAIRLLELDGTGKVRVLAADNLGGNRAVRTFAFDGTEVPSTTPAFLPVTRDIANSRYAFDHTGGFYFLANRVDAVALGTTNLAALGGSGAQSWVLGRFDAAGSNRWWRAFGGPLVGVVDPFRVMVGADDSALVAGSFGIGNQVGLSFQIGTNVLKGYGYAAKYTPVGDVAWAKAWWLHVDDAALGRDGGVYLSGWLRDAADPRGGYTRKVPFGTNVIAGASLTGHDTFVAKVDGEGREVFIRHTGSPDFKTFDNAREYPIAVDSRGTVWTAGFSLFQPTAAALDFGDLRFQWPDLRPFNIGSLFGELPAFYLAHLDPRPEGGGPVVPAEVVVRPPAPGSTTLRLEWPPGTKLQRLQDLSSGAWETLPVTSPYEVDLLRSREGYFRVGP